MITKTIFSVQSRAVIGYVFAATQRMAVQAVLSFVKVMFAA